MRIAQVAPLHERVPPCLYGGTERVVHWLTEELVRRGHEVTLFASGDSQSSAGLVAPVPRALRLDPGTADPIGAHLLQIGMIADRAEEFDVIHSHVDYFAYPFARHLRTPLVHTVHGRLETAHLAGRGAIAIRTDVTDEASLQAAIRTTVDPFGRLDVLHNNAGGSTPQDYTVIEAPIEEFWRVIRLDLFGTFLGCRHGIPALIRSGGGAVINMASNLALMGITGRDCYTAAKGGIAALTRSLAVEFAPQRVRVNAIAPSATMTARVQKLMAGNPAIDKLAQSHLLGLIQHEDIANAALYLASEDSRMVTGQILSVDSGVTIA